MDFLIIENVTHRLTTSTSPLGVPVPSTFLSLSNLPPTNLLYLSAQSDHSADDNDGAVDDRDI